MIRVGSRRGRVVLIVAAVVVIAAIAAGVDALSSGSPRFTGPTAAALYAAEAKFGTFGAYVAGSDPDETDRGGNNVDDTITFLGNGRYRLTVQNVGFLGYLNSFEWNAPNLVITKVLSSSSGSCTAQPDKIVTTQYGNLPEASVSCSGMAIAPPKCSCLGGGTATVTFEGHPLAAAKHVHYGVEESRLVVGDMTLVPYHIPSYLGGKGNQYDEPLCTKGQKSTASQPCVQTS